MSVTSRYLVDCVVGARPNFVKIAPVMRALAANGRLVPGLIHTGQHYDVAMNKVFFDELGVPEPDVCLEIGPGTGIEQTARVMLGLEPVLLERRPDMLLVVGDVNSTAAAALAGAKLRIPVAHVESGLRSGDRSMPEEINRLVTDQISDLLFVTEQSALDNLAREGVDAARAVFVGNVMIDALYASLDRAAPARTTLAALAGARQAGSFLTQGYAFITLHRPSNVDDAAKLAATLRVLREIARRIPLVFPLHPRTASVIERAGLWRLLEGERFIVSTPLSYLQTIGLVREARFVITDSGGLQEETTGLGVPCLTYRDNTERPVTIEEGGNVLVGSSPGALLAAVDEFMRTGGRKGRIPALWDGRASERIATRIAVFLDARRERRRRIAERELAACI